MSFPARIRQLPPFDGPFDAYRLTADSCDVLFASYPASTAIADHSHKTHNIGVVTEGELILTVEGRETRYGPGDWYEVPAGAMHSARFDEPTSEIELWFEVGGDR